MEQESTIEMQMGKERTQTYNIQTYQEMKKDDNLWEMDNSTLETMIGDVCLENSDKIKVTIKKMNIGVVQEEIMSQSDNIEQEDDEKLICSINKKSADELKEFVKQESKTRIWELIENESLNVEKKIFC